MLKISVRLDIRVPALQSKHAHKLSFQSSISQIRFHLEIKYNCRFTELFSHLLSNCLLS